jgi:hypothetical protein
MVRAKFVVTSITHEADGEGATIELHPVGGGWGGQSEENKAFYRLTPGGAIMLSTINAAAAAQFRKGVEFYVDFTPAE